MKLKQGLQISTSEFWYDLTQGGYIKTEEICEHLEDSKKVNEAIAIVREFEESCEEQIEDFML